MGYYMGDFYRGYRGDPGFWSFAKGLIGKAAGLIPVVGPAISPAIEMIGKARSAAVKVAAPVVAAGGKMVKVAGEHPVLTAAGAAGVATAGTAIMRRGSRAAAGMASQPSGRGGGFGRHKRMNVCNPRALRRAIRRTHGFAKLAMKTIHLVHPKKHYTFGGFKRVKHTPRRKKR